MSDRNINELNQIMLVAMKEQLPKHTKLKGRTICLFCLADNGRGQYVGTIMDKATSLAPRFLIPKEAVVAYGKPVMLGIMKGLLEGLEQTIGKVKVNPFNWKKFPIKAKGRSCVLDGEVKVSENTVLELYSWSKLVT